MSAALEQPGLVSDRHKSVLALLKAHPEERDPKIIIRKLARQRVAKAKSLGWAGPAFCPKILASLFNVHCRMVDDLVMGDGRILQHPDGKLWIEYLSGRTPQRQRFTIFHEFAHTLFSDYCRLLPHHQNARKSPKDPEKEFEDLCDMAASEMLLPLDEVTEDLKKISPICFEEFDRLSRRYDASIDATLHRFIELIDTHRCAVAFLTDQQGAFFGHGPLWVKYSRYNRLFRGFIAPGAVPPAGSVAFDCYRNSRAITQSARETWWINGSPRTWLAQAMKLPTIPEAPHYPKVAVLLLPSGYKPVSIPENS